MKPKIPVKHKFKAKPTVANGRRYDSKREAEHAMLLASMEKQGTVVGFLEQVPVRLQGGIKYVVDFLVFYSDGTAEFFEVKGYETPQWKMKMKMLKEAEPWIEIKVVK